MKTRGMALAVMLVGMGSQAWAGYKSSGEVVVGSTYAYGSLGSARNSADVTQYIQCYVVSSVGNGIGLVCTARSSTNQFVQCTTSDAGLIQAAGAINGDSNLYFAFDANNACTQVRIINSSAFEPKR